VLDADGQPEQINEVEKIFEVDLTTIEVEGFNSDNQRVVSKRPLSLKPKLDDTKQHYILDDAALGIQLLAGSRDELEEALYEELDFLWRHYVKEADDLLADDALALRRQLLETFEDSV